jgi:hypothetical protein
MSLIRTTTTTVLALAAAALTAATFAAGADGASRSPSPTIITPGGPIGVKVKLPKLRGACAGHTFTRALAPVGDKHWYMLAPAGDFESNVAAAWTLAPGAGVQEGTQTRLRFSGRDHQSLRLPPGSSATSAEQCVTTDYRSLRLFARNTGDPKGRLIVELRYRDPVLGLIPTIFRAGALKGTSSWDLSDSLATRAGVTGTTMSIRLTAQGGNWSVDDILVDPRMRS